MDESILELLQKVTLYDLMWSVFLIILLTGILISQKKKISKFMDKWRKDKNDEENFHSLVYELKESIDRLSIEVKQNQENRDKELLQYRDNSREIRNKMYEIMDKQSEDIKNLASDIADMREKDSKTKRADIKEKIERIYRECHPTKICTDMQFEVLKDFIEEYEGHGGTNSFVHTKVVPEMYEWKIICAISTKEV